jgi:asparagine synthase (glutamine-hydrolysing)
MGEKYQRVPGFLRRSLISPFLERIPPTEKKKGLINRAKRFDEGMKLPDDLQHTRWMIFLQEKEKQRLYNPDMHARLNGFDAFGFIRDYFNRVNTPDLLNRQLYVDIKSYLVDDILVKVDRMSMATSLEARVPFLDHRFVEFTATIPSSLKLKGTTTKYLLKKAMGDLLPHDILYRGKEGFSIPIKNWLKNELKDLMLDVLSPRKVRKEGFFQADYVEKLIKEHLNGKENHSHRLWAMMVFGIWQEIYLRKGNNVHEQAIKTSHEFATI